MDEPVIRLSPPLLAEEPVPVLTKTKPPVIEFLALALGPARISMPPPSLDLLAPPRMEVLPAAPCEEPEPTVTSPARPVSESPELIESGPLPDGPAPLWMLMLPLSPPTAVPDRIATAPVDPDALAPVWMVTVPLVPR